MVSYFFFQSLACLAGFGFQAAAVVRELGEIKPRLPKSLSVRIPPSVGVLSLRLEGAGGGGRQAKPVLTIQLVLFCWKLTKPKKCGWCLGFPTASSPPPLPSPPRLHQNPGPVWVNLSWRISRGNHSSKRPSVTSQARSHESIFRYGVLEVWRLCSAYSRAIKRLSLYSWYINKPCLQTP